VITGGLYYENQLFHVQGKRGDTKSVCPRENRNWNAVDFPKAFLSLLRNKAHGYSDNLGGDALQNSGGLYDKKYVCS